MTINGLHLELHSAYKKHHSTESALLKVKNDILLNMDAQKVSLLALLDLSAAFDTVRHDILLDRLRSRLGVTDQALNWFTSYLSDRTQHVAVKVIPLFCTAHPVLRITLLHPRWRRFFPLARKEQTRAAFAELKLLFAIIMPQIG